MRLFFTTLLSFSSLFIFAQNNSDCRFGEVLANYNKILPLEKVYVHSDQSYYEPGETIWFKAYLVDERLKAKAQSNQLIAVLLDPKGNSYAELKLPVEDGSTKGDFLLQSTAAGGIYTLQIYSKWQKNFGKDLIFEKKLTVQKYMVPNLLMTLDFLRESYGPGSEVLAKLKVRSKDDLALANHSCNFTVELDGEKHYTGQVSTNDEGLALLNFQLPEDLKTADGLLNIMIEYEGNTESISRSIPIVTRNISMQLMPEGGDMIAGINSKVAFKAVDEFGKPVDFNGRVIDSKGQEVLCFESYHQGMGTFQLEPQKGESYKVQIYEPLGIEQKFDLPKALSNGIALQMEAQDKKQMRFNLYSPKAEPLCIIVQMQGALVFEMGLEAQVGENIVKIPTQSFPLGIAQVTVFDAQELAHAERLVFVNKHRQLNIAVQTHRPTYQIRDSVMLEIQVTDETGRGVQGDFSLAVVDDKLWTFADDKQDNILSYLLMSSDLKGKVYEPNFYFDKKEPKADLALDLVMLTHGWRRYQWRELMAKDAAKNWRKQRQFEPEPLTALVGSILLNGQPLTNTALQVLPAIDSCYNGPLNIKTDEKGLFSIPNIDSRCPIALVAKHRGFKEIYSSPTYFHYASKPIKQNNVIFQGARDFTVEPRKKSKSSSGLYVTRVPGGYTKIDAQNSGVFKGTVSDEEGESIPFATIKLMVDGVIKYGCHTDIDGNFQIINITPGIYNCQVSYVGYQTYEESNLEIRSNQVFSKNIILGNEAVLLETVITSKRVNSSTIKMLSTVPGIANNTAIARVERKEKATKTLDNQKEEVTNITPVEVLNPEVRGRALIAQDIVRIPVQRNIADLRAIRRVETRVINKIPSENTANYEMNRQKGELPINRGSDRIQNNGTFQWQQSSPLRFDIKQAGPPNFYTGKAFYAPDHSAYLQARNSGQPTKAIRKDFRNTIFWQPYLNTDKDGKAKLLFYNSDAVSTFRIIIEGLDMQGGIGRGEQTYSVQMPFEMTAKIPRILTFGDSVQLSFVLKNNTNSSLEGSLGIHLPSSLVPIDTEIDSIYSIPANAFKVVKIPFFVKSATTAQKIVLDFNANGAYDRRVLEFEVHSKGFPINLTLAGNQLQRNGSFEIKDLVDGSISAKLEVYANVLENLQSAMEGMLRAPSGCFEQVSSSTYPNIMALQMLKASNELQPNIYSRAHRFIDDGYKRLAAYESPGGGFDWWGKAPAHEGLTAYGLMEFHDMNKVYGGVNPAMIQRARSWLLSRKDNRGGFLAAGGYSHGWGNVLSVRNAYIVYALAYIGEKNIEKELALATTEAEQSKDLYRLGLVTLANFYAGNDAKGEVLLTLLNSSISKKGLNTLSAEHSITYSYGLGLQTEIIAFAAMANMQSKSEKGAITKRYIDKLMSLRQSGYFGSTQSTVFALKALCQYVKQLKEQKAEEGTLYVYINKKQVLEKKVNTKQSTGLQFNDLAKYFKEGKNELEIKFEGLTEGLPYNLEIDWHSLTPPSAKDCPLRVKTTMAKYSGRQGETLRLSSKVTNISDRDAPSAMAMIGIPSGLSLQPWQLKELLEKEKVASYEIFDNYLVLYYRNISSGESSEINLDLKAEVAGNYLAPASCAYLYYTPEYKQWIPGERVRIDY